MDVPTMDKKQTNWGLLFKYSGIAFDIVIFAIIGYIIGQQYGKEVLGTLIGTLIGTFFMWFHLFWATGVIKSRGKQK